MESFLVFAVIHDDIEAAGHGDKELMAFFQGVPGAVRASGDVVEIKNALNGERDMAVAFEKGEIAPRIIDLGEFDDAALAEFHGERCVSEAICEAYCVLRIAWCVLRGA
jgi:hypothetical protein